LEPLEGIADESIHRCSASVLEKVCQYFYYYEKYKGQKDVPEPDFITPELALELLFIADFLDC
jgi:transcription elongation factor B subunit 1